MNRVLCGLLGHGVFRKDDAKGGPVQCRSHE
jgi:hypothetical protein